MSDLTNWSNKFRLDIDSRNIDEELVDFPAPIKIGSAVGVNQVDMTKVMDLLDNGGNDQYTKLLLQAPGRYGSHAFFDESQSKHTINTYGETKAVRHPLNDGSGVMYFPGSSSILTTAASLDFLLGDTWTIDCWINPTSFKVSYNTIFTWSNNVNAWFQVWLDGSGQVKIGTNTQGEQTWSGTTFPLNQWNHLAIVSSNSLVTVYKNGVNLGSKTCTYPVSGTFEVRIGWDTVAGREFTGYMTEYRVSKGIARWTSDFVVPSYQYDIADFNTKLLLHFNECNNSGLVKDSSQQPKVMRAVGASKVIHQTGKFSERPLTDCDGALYFAAVGDYLSIPNSTSWNFGANEFTIEFLAHIRDNTTWQTIINRQADDSQCTWLSVVVYNGSLLLYATSTGSNWDITSGGKILTSISTGWHHIAITRSSSQIRSYVDGVLVNTISTTASILNNSNSLLIAGNIPSSTFRGSLSNIRISNISRYTANFVPADSKYTVDAYTKLLINTDYNSSSSVVDSSVTNHVITKHGKSKLMYLPKFDGDTSVYFDGSGDCLSVIDSDDWKFGADNFTIDFWVKRTSVGVRECIFGQSDSASSLNSLSICVTFETSNLMFVDLFDVVHTTFRLSSTSTFTNNMWYHIAIVRFHGTVCLYINGGLDNVMSMPQICNDSSSAFVIGRLGEYNGLYFNGSIVNFRITKGIARWSNDFTPPISYVVDSNTKLLINSSLSDETGKTVTIVGNTRVQNLQWPQNSVYFDGSGDYLSLSGADFNLSTSDFTMDFWLRLNSTPGYMRLRSSHYYAAGYDGNWAVKIYPGILQFASYDGAGSTPEEVTANLTWEIGKWYHIAIIRASGILTIYLNGISVASGMVSKSLSDGASGWYISCPSESINGHIANFRLSDNVRWASNFTLPSSEYVIDEYTKLLIQPKSASIVDDVGHSITVNGNTKVVMNPLFSKVINFDGIDDYCSILSSNDFNFGNDDFTVDFWCKGTAGVGAKLPFSSLSTHIGVQVNAFNNETRFHYGIGSSDPFASSSKIIVDGDWHHVACVRYGSTFSIYIDGIKGGITSSYSGTVGDSVRPFYIGTNFGLTASELWSGQITNLSVTKGIARWTSNFIPPVSVEPDQYTKLLVNADHGIIDINHPSKTITPYGDAKIVHNYVVDKALYFNGAGDYLTIPDSNDWYFDGDFTIDLWVNFSTIPSNDFSYLLIQNPDDLNYWCIYLENRDAYASYKGIRFGGRNNNVASTSIYQGDITGWTANIWYHIALVRCNESYNLYVNGNLVPTTTTVGAALPNTTGVMTIGGVHLHPTVGKFHGCIANLRISKGVARWTTGFTPPSLAYGSFTNRKKLSIETTQPVDGYTKLLVTPSGEQVIDTAENRPIVSNIVGKSIYLDGTGDYVVISDHVDFEFEANDFTIDFWINNIGANAPIYTKRSGQSNTTAGCVVGKHIDDTIRISVTSNNTSWDMFDSTIVGSITKNEWQHVAVVRSGSNWYAFINGTKTFTAINTAAIASNFYDVYLFGQTSGTSPVYLNAYISKFRVAKGIARWTNNFDPYTVDYTIDGNTVLFLDAE